LLVTCLFWEKSSALWWLMSQINVMQLEFWTDGMFPYAVAES
jgi:hypothetical protein